MTTKAILKGMIVTLFITQLTFAQQTPISPTDSAHKLSVVDRMAKARAAKAEKKVANSAPGSANQSKADRPTGLKAVSVDYKAPVDRSQKGPNGEVVHTGERGGKYYINKNGNKTYLSSNQ